MNQDTIEVWIQAADLSSRDLGLMTRAQAWAAFQGEDWDYQNRRLQELMDSAPKDNCMPGMGFVVGDGHLLHLLPQNGGVLWWILNRPGPSGFWARLFVKTQIVGEGHVEQAAELIGLLYDAAFERLWQRTESAQRQRDR